jgi:hypothetical protein
MYAAPVRLNSKLSLAVRRGVRVAAAILLSAWLTGVLWAAETKMAGGPMIQRSMRVVPRKFVILPSGATVPINQTQHFGVLDSSGKAVAVRWNVSGLGCYGASCGSMDEEGVYHPPPTLPQPRIVTLEGVVVSDPRYSVLTEIKLEGDAATANSATVAGVIEERQLAAPEAPQEREISSRVESLPTPRPVDAAPAVRAEDAIRAMIDANRVPLPSAVSAAPPVQRQDIASRATSMPVPSAVRNAPAVRNVEMARAEPLPLPIVVGAAPMIAAQSMARRTALPPTPAAVAAAPVVDRRPAMRSSDQAPLPSPIMAAPQPGAPVLATRVEPVPVPQPVAAPPAVERAAGSRKADLVPLPHAVAAAPSVAAEELPSKIELVSGPVVVTSAPKTERRDNNRPSGSPTLATTAATPVAKELPGNIELVSGPVVVTGVPKAEQRENIRSSSSARPAPSTFTSSPIAPAPVASVPVPTASVPAVASLAPPKAASVDAQPVLMASRQVPDATSVLRAMVDESARAPAPADLLPQDAARVIYRDGQLTIDARNSTLAEVLNLVGQKTGATIEIPPGSGQERIFEHAGPGKPNDVLTQLLNGSHLNFIIVNSPDHPENVARVLLSVEREDNQTAAAAPVPNLAILPGMYKPSEDVGPQTLPPEYNTDLKVPAESLSPEARGDLMKEMIRKLGEKAAQQAPPQ